MAGSWRLASVALLSFASGPAPGPRLDRRAHLDGQEGVDIKVIGLFTPGPGALELQAPLVAGHGPLPAAVPGPQARLHGPRACWPSRPAPFGLAAVSDSPAGVGTIGALCAGDRLRLRHPRHRLRRLHGGGAAPRGAGARGGRAQRLLPRGHARLGRRGDHPRGGLGLGRASTSLLGLVYLPFCSSRFCRPSPRSPPQPPKTLRDAVWGPFVGFLASTAPSRSWPSSCSTS